MLSLSPLLLDSAMLDEARVFLRIDQEYDDPSLEAILLAAIGHAEEFTGQVLIRRTVREIVPSAPQAQKLSAAPVVEIGPLSAIPADGTRFPIDPAQYTSSIERGGDGCISLLRPGAAGRIEIQYTAGLSPSWGELPESLRLGILRLTGHLFAHRDDLSDPGPPAAVAALLRPWRRIRLFA